MAERAKYPRSDFADFVTHPPADPYWDQMHYIRDDDRFEMPILWINSWFDVTPEQTLYLANLARRNATNAVARDNQFVIMSPTAHCLSEAAGAPTKVGAREFGDARLPYFQIYLDWFDHWLRGAPNGASQRPRFQYYQMGDNQWLTSPTWPVASAREVVYNLTARKSALTGSGDGRLTTTRPPQGRDAFVYDPDHPLPSLGGTVCCTGNPKDEPGAFDQRSLEGRSDLLVYSTEPLAQPVAVTGSVRAILQISSDAKDTDFTAKLIDVDLEGRAWNVANGVQRARYRAGAVTPIWLELGKTYEVTVSLKATAHTFLPGHRIRLWISSSDFPLHDRNLNTGGDNVTETTWIIARNVVHYGGPAASRLILPIVPRQ
jgi:putative CocE/NonD family hydrolase